ncbi:MAG: hypothetical protein SF053_17635 [Bacteroidia bacterium]|nr:hypothetical protein [Bacteroidia bacterium]
MVNILHKATAVRIDCIVRKDTVYRKTELARRIRKPMGSFDAYVTTLEDLILSKLIWIQALQSEKQMGDVRQLLEVQHPDYEYLTYWIDQLNLNTFDLL